MVALTRRADSAENSVPSYGIGYQRKQGGCDPHSSGTRTIFVTETAAGDCSDAPRGPRLRVPSLAPECGQITQFASKPRNVPGVMHVSSHVTSHHEGVWLPCPGCSRGAHARGGQRHVVRAALREAIARPPAEGPSQPLGAGWGAEVGRPRTGVSEQNPSARPSLRVAAALLRLDRDLGET